MIRKGGKKKYGLGGVTGGLWYRNDITNNNNEWQPVDDFWSSLNISCITYDPNDPMIFFTLAPVKLRQL